MTDMAGNEHLTLFLSSDDTLPVSQGTVLECRDDADFIGSLWQLIELPLREAESPTLLVIRRSIGNPVRIISQRMKIWPEVRQRHSGLHWHAVVNDMEVTLLKINHSMTILVFY